MSIGRIALKLISCGFCGNTAPTGEPKDSQTNSRTLQTILNKLREENYSNLTTLKEFFTEAEKTKSKIAVVSTVASDDTPENWLYSVSFGEIKYLNTINNYNFDLSLSRDSDTESRIIDVKTGGLGWRHNPRYVHNTASSAIRFSTDEKDPNKEFFRVVEVLLEDELMALKP